MVFAANLRDKASTALYAAVARTSADGMGGLLGGILNCLVPPADQVRVPI
jgi:hypothetical protein